MTSPADEPNVSPGDVLAGKYFVTRVIGRGGMGVVVEAKHAELHERVAIKVLHKRYLDNAEALARFQHEARASVRIRGEHSARLLDIGTTDAGAPFIVMELLEGADLSQIIRSGLLPVQEAVLYILQACEGMAEVHAHGIVHRDLKPGNLFVSRRPDGTPLVKVLDFGIAKSTLPMNDGERAVTMTLVALGTPLYMSPEQIRSSRDVDARADVWSLGAILYELLAGRPAFGGNSVANITAQVLEAQPPSVAAIRPEVSPELDKALGRALAKKPEQRFVDVAAFAKAIAPFAGEAGQAHAERAARILRGEGRGIGATRFTATGTALPPTDAAEGPETLLQTEVFTTLGPQKGRRRKRALGALAAAAVATFAVGWAVLREVQLQQPAPLLAAKGLAGESAVRSAVVVTAARMAAAAIPAPTGAPSVTATTSIPAKTSKIRDPAPPSTAAAVAASPPPPPPPPRAKPAPAGDDDPLSSRR
jgi:eukaryotic-like serine/threonine-protein kinase